MIIIFIVLGLGFLGGGLAAIVDGAPYMVLERGFTQVIIGTVVAVAGVLMLALSRVLVEIRRLKATMSGAAVAMSMASMAGAPVAETSPPRSGIRPDSRDALLPAGLPAAGALAGVGAALAAAKVSATPTPEAGPDEGLDASASGADADLAEVQPPEAKAAPDLFGAYLERSFAPTAEAEAPAQPASREADDDAFAAAEPDGPAAAPQLSDSALIADVDRAFDWPPLRIVETESEPLSDASRDPDSDDETTAEPDAEPPGLPGPSDIDDPFSRDLAPLSLSQDDEFGRLRESLAGLGLGPAAIDGRTEPDVAAPADRDEAAAESAGDRAEELAAAASWMEPAAVRQAPWFDAPASPQDTTPTTAAPETQAASAPSWPVLDVADRSVPSWLSQPRDVRFSAPDSGRWAIPDVEHPMADQPVAEPVAPVTFAPEPDASEAHEPESAAPEPAAPEPAPIDDAPAASDEGIVGAYQVGEAHFTIYADGSIQARTPDGDYSFGSMDELKIYLASEKSRLGT